MRGGRKRYKRGHKLRGWFGCALCLVTTVCPIFLFFLIKCFLNYFSASSHSVLCACVLQGPSVSYW